MSWTLLLPSLVVLASTWIGFGVLRHRLTPPAALVVMAMIMVSTASAVAAIVFLTAAGFLIQTPVLASLASWCSLLPAHHDVGPNVGIPALLVAIVITRRVSKVWRADRSALRAGRECCRRWGSPVGVVDSDRPIAYAVPGRRGGVVVSSGMLGSLSADERKVLMAHERAHLRGHHHGFVLAATLATAVMPLLGPLSDRVKLATERLADEAAVEAVAGNRRLVASAIARASIVASGSGSFQLSITGSSTVHRVRALGQPGPSVTHPAVMAAAVAVVITSWVASSVQFHHLAGLFAHICG